MRELWRVWLGDFDTSALRDRDDLGVRVRVGVRVGGGVMVLVTVTLADASEERETVLEGVATKVSVFVSITLAVFVCHSDTVAVLLDTVG